MRILFINNDGGGFADQIEINQGTTATQLFEERIGGEPAAFLIRVNRQPVTGDHVLVDGDRVSITPVKIEGARPHRAA